MATSPDSLCIVYKKKMAQKSRLVLTEVDSLWKKRMMSKLKKKVYGWGCLQINVRVLLPIQRCKGSSSVQQGTWMIHF
ncbi:hypothetical protein MKW98_003095 [Papaver atlanticum]|uniref:Uncharacterized protein n=1 Tax=Papaver atlanticum TaxID=357466 RepID=A0AAD4XWL1_9MAGN|nr:hypothetical protein MKW98_003095 [Papaver atlanticum]